MNKNVLNDLIATGQASYGTYVGTGGLIVLKVPDNNGIVITGITLHAFADLAAGQTFDSLANVVNATWHQLRVIGETGINAFQARHEIREYNVGGTAFYLPQGLTRWDVFLNHKSNVIIDLIRCAPYLGAAIIVNGTLPATIARPSNPNVPGGYGKTGAAGSLSSLELLTVAGTWQYRPYNTFTRSNPAGIDSKTQLVLPTNATTQLKAPQQAIAYGSLTMPIIEVDYILYNKTPDMTYSPPVSI
jgi:hypothetical protein